MQRVIGIDFGTSTTYMNVKRYDGSKPVEDRFSYMPIMFNYGETSGYVSSVVRKNADGSFDFGDKALESLGNDCIYTAFKMRLESPDATEREEIRFITRKFFRFLYDTYTQQSDCFGGDDDEVETIVSYPVKWREETVEFMLSAAREAGFPNVSGMDEASAAVSAVICQNSTLFAPEDDGYLLLVDMGAGTTDLVVCGYLAGANGVAIRMVTNWPQSADEPSFGGREVDTALETYVETYLTDALIPALAPQAHVMATAPGQAKQWKERNVSENLAANRTVNKCAYIGTYRTMGMLNSDFPPFDRASFERIIQSGLKDYAKLLHGCLNSAAEKNADFAEKGIDLVLLTGGHSAWYFAREIIDGTMPAYLDDSTLRKVRLKKERVIGLKNPQATVSLGLVYSKLHVFPEAPLTVGTPKHPEDPKQPPSEIGRKTTEFCTVTINRPYHSFFCAAKMCVSVDGVQKGVIAILGHARIQVSKGLHTFTFVEKGDPKARVVRTVHMNVTEDLDWTVEWAQHYTIRVFSRPSRAPSTVGAVELPEETSRTYRWDKNLISEIQSYIAAYDQRFIRKVFSARTVKIRQNFSIPYDIEIFLAHDDGGILTAGKSGFALCSNGIYDRDYSILLKSKSNMNFMSWEEFMNGEIGFGNTPLYLLSGNNRFSISYNIADADAVFKPSLDDIYIFLRDLQKLLRERACMVDSQ